MKWTGNYNNYPFFKKRSTWYKWFAWYPVIVLSNRIPRVVWLKTVERKTWFGYGIWGILKFIEYEYREIED